MKAQTSVAELEYFPDRRIMEMHFKKDAEIDIEQVKEIEEVRNKLTGNDRYAVLVCFKGRFITPTKEGREYAAKGKTASNILATAIVVNSLSLKLIVRSYIFFNRPRTKTQMFNKKEKAIKWLNKILKDSA